MGPTPHRNLRAADSVWGPFQDRAHERGLTGAAVARAAMRAYSAGLLDDVLAPFLASDNPDGDPSSREIPGQEQIPLR